MASNPRHFPYMFKKEVLKALVDVDATTTELANYIGCSTTTLYKFLNGRIINYQRYVNPLHEFFTNRGLTVDFKPHIWAVTGVIYLDDLTQSQLSSLGVERIN